MKNFLAIFILTITITATVVVAVETFDRHMYPGVDVIKQEGNILFVKLDEELTLGTDMMCLEAARVLSNVAEQSRLHIKVVPSKPGGWAPFNNRVVSYLDLVNIIESGMPY